MLVAAYDDAAGVTAEFNKNVLTVVNRELGADFDPARSTMWRCGTAEQSGSRCGCGPAATLTVKIPGAGSGGRLRGGRGDAHRDLGEVPQGGHRGRTGRGGDEADALVDGRGRTASRCRWPRRSERHGRAHGGRASCPRGSAAVRRISAVSPAAGTTRHSEAVSGSSPTKAAAPAAGSSGRAVR